MILHTRCNTFSCLVVGTNNIFRKIPRKFTTASLRNNNTRYFACYSAATLGICILFLLCSFHQALFKPRKELNNLETFDVIALFMTSIATIALVALAGFLLEGNGMEESLLKVTFIGLAALTVPHMLLVDLYPRIRTTSF